MSSKQEVIAAREVLYPELTVSGVPIPRENLRVTAETAKALLGWKAESEHEKEVTAGLSEELAAKANVKFGAMYDFIDANGEKIRCANNTHNRPLNEMWVKTLAQDILNGNWRFNGETWVIGKTGLALSLQHRAYALIVAEQLRQKDNEQGAHWRSVHPEPLSIEALVVCGIEETPDVTRTLDNVRARSLMDVLFTDSDIFHGTRVSDRKALCKMVDFAIRTVWQRMGSEDAFSPMRTHSESMEFLSRHPSLLVAVKDIFDENTIESNNKEDKKANSNRIGKIINPGIAAGLMWLMGTCTTDRDEYFGSEDRNDHYLNLDTWDQARAFWMLLASNTPEFDGVRLALANLSTPDLGADTSKNPIYGLGGTMEEKMHVLVNAWNEYIAGGVLTASNLKPEYSTPDEYGVRKLVGTPDVGGLDLGNARKVAQEAARKAREEAKAAAEAAVDEGLDGEDYAPNADFDDADGDSVYEDDGEDFDDDEDVEFTEEELEARKAQVRAEHFAKKANEPVAPLTPLPSSKPKPGSKPPAPVPVAQKGGGVAGVERDANNQKIKKPKPGLKGGTN